MFYRLWFIRAHIYTLLWTDHTCWPKGQRSPGHSNSDGALLERLQKSFRGVCQNQPTWILLPELRCGGNTYQYFWEVWYSFGASSGHFLDGWRGGLRSGSFVRSRWLCFGSSAKCNYDFVLLSIWTFLSFWTFWVFLDHFAQKSGIAWGPLLMQQSLR